MRVLIVGGGIGGLTAGLALLRAGFEVHVHEQASTLREVGAGLTMGPNAVRILHRLGLAAALRSTAVTPLSRDARDWQTGELLARLSLEDDIAESRWGAPLYMMHRADLHAALRQALGDEHVSLGTRCISVEQDEELVTVTFADGQRASGDLLVGADGIHSVVRGYVAGPDKANWTGQIAWRALAPASVGLEAGLELRHHFWWGPGTAFSAYYVSGGSAINWIGMKATDDDWREEPWSARGDRAEVLAHFEGWHEQVRSLIAGTEVIFKWGLFDRAPLTNWTRGRVTLLGDAAHPMLPNMGQGAAQSIEDAVVLASCLAVASDDPESALATYVSLRRARTTAMQAAASNAARTMQLSDPVAIAARNARMGEDRFAQLSANDWIFGYDPEGPAAQA
jgi:salicylate hydroxylase